MTKLCEEIKQFKEKNTAENVTRLEVIDKTGRVYTKWNCKIKLSYQDNDKTLKIFVNE